MNETLPERFRGRRRDNARSIPNLFEENGFELELNLDIRRYVQAQDKIQSTSNRDSWLQLSELPTSEEVASPNSDTVELAPNKIRGPWKSTEKYFKAHYELLREDAVSPLRDAVDTFRKDPEMSDDKQLCVYEKVCCLPQFGCVGLIFIVGPYLRPHIFTNGYCGTRYLFHSTIRTKDPLGGK